MGLLHPFFYKHGRRGRRSWDVYADQPLKRKFFMLLHDFIYSFITFGGKQNFICDGVWARRYLQPLLCYLCTLFSLHMIYGFGSKHGGLEKPGFLVYLKSTGFWMLHIHTSRVKLPILRLGSSFMYSVMEVETK